MRHAPLRSDRSLWRLALGASLTAGVFATLVAGPSVQATPILMPAPSHMEPGGRTHRIKGPFRLVWEGEPREALQQAVSRLNDDLARQGALPSGEGDVLVVACAHGDPNIPALETTEAYALTVAGHRTVLKADAATGIVRGLATLRQLIEAGPQGPTLRDVAILDAPRFAWRGVMVDVARHFMSIAALKRQIDAMELVKLNVLHLHLSDNEGFRVESHLFPRLQEKGSHGQFYTQDELKDLVAYAAKRSIRLVPEFDVPGHTLAILAAYPELASGPIKDATYLDGLASALNPANPDTFKLVLGLYGEMADLFPDRYIHIGGDEVDGGHWARNAQIQDFMKANGLATKRDLERYFHDRLIQFLQARGKIVVGWEELGRIETDPKVMIQAWQGSGSIYDATAAGHPVIVSAGYYLDLLYDAATAYAADPQDPSASGLDAEQAARVRRHPLFGPRVAKAMVRDPSLVLTSDEAAMVKGGEAALWSETITEEMLDHRLWPRAAAVAERLWSPRDVRDLDDMRRRLFGILPELRRAGLRDRIARDAMIERIAPANALPVKTLVDVTAPVRNYAHNHSLRALLQFKRAPPQSFDQLADIASPDNEASSAMAADVKAYLAGDRKGLARLRRRLEALRDNDAAFAVVAAGRPALEAALPASKDLKALAILGLEALADREAHQSPDAEWRGRAHELLARQARQRAASDTSFLALISTDLPPGDLVIDIAPSIDVLVAAAEAPQ